MVTQSTKSSNFNTSKQGALSTGSMDEFAQTRVITGLARIASVHCTATGARRLWQENTATEHAHSRLLATKHNAS